MLYPLPGGPWEPYAPTPTHVPASCGACWQSFPPAPYAWSSVPASWSSYPSRECLHHGPAQESSRQRGRGSNGRALRQSPYPRTAASVVPASQWIRHRGGWWARQGEARQASATIGGREPHDGVHHRKDVLRTGLRADNGGRPWRAPACCRGSRHRSRR